MSEKPTGPNCRPGRSGSGNCMLGHAGLSTNAICAVGRAAEWCAASKCQMLSGLDAAQLKYVH